MLIPVYFLIGLLRRAAAAVRRGQVPALQPRRRAADAGRARRPLHRRRASSARGTFDFRALTDLHISNGIQKALFLGFFIAFAIKAPMWPVHTWLPDAAAEATPGVAVMLVAVLDKVGTFGMIRYCLPLFPDATQVLRALYRCAQRHRGDLRRPAGDRPDAT